MITIPLYSILFLYLLVLTLFTVFMAINFYHISISGSFTFTSFVITFFTIVLTILTLYFTIVLLSGVNWSQPITLFNLDWFRSVSF